MSATKARAILALPAPQNENAPPYRFNTGVNVYSIEEAVFYCREHWLETAGDVCSDGFCEWLRGGLGLPKAAEKVAAAPAGSLSLKFAALTAVTGCYDAESAEKLLRDITAWERRSEWEKLKTLGDGRARRGDYNAARRDYEAALRLRENGALLNNLAVALMNLGEYGEAAKIFERALSPAPGDTRVLLNYAEALARSGDTVNAARALEGLGDDETAEIRYLRGLIATGEGRPEEAAELFGKAAELSDGAARAGYIRATVDSLIQGRAFKKAAALAETELESCPSDARLWKRLAFCRRQARDYAGADAAVTKALELSPNDPEALLEKARISKRRGKHDDYRARLSDAISALKAAYPRDE